ncbi:MAG: class I SAM-dependent methyltransferase [Vicinamibacterales bacterium]
MSDESIWKARAGKFMALEHLSQERALHPVLLRLIEQGSGDRLLDYGCGDGRILARLSNRWRIDAYDPSEQMRELAQLRVGSRLSRMAANLDDLEGRYDVIILGMIILVLPHEDDVRRVLQECACRMDNSSRLFITTTHPCFRASDFSNFSTSFGRTQPFSYLLNGTPFEVTLRDHDVEGIVFTDYHWSLSFTLNALSSEGLSVVSMLEVPDDPESSSRNPLVPPFLIMECRRSS